MYLFLLKFCLKTRRTVIAWLSNFSQKQYDNGIKALSNGLTQREVMCVERFKFLFLFFFLQHLHTCTFLRQDNASKANRMLIFGH